MMYICPVHVKFTKVVLVYIAVPVLATVAVIGIQNLHWLPTKKRTDYKMMVLAFNALNILFVLFVCKFILPGCGVLDQI